MRTHANTSIAGYATNTYHWSQRTTPGLIIERINMNSPLVPESVDVGCLLLLLLPFLIRCRTIVIQTIPRPDDIPDNARLKATQGLEAVIFYWYSLPMEAILLLSHRWCCYSLNGDRSCRDQHHRWWVPYCSQRCSS
jgi:hypothetical protein